MKKRNFIGKRILAFLLLTALLLPMIPDNVTLVFAENTADTEGYITDVTGLEVWENVWLKESVTVIEDVTVVGNVKMEPGVSIEIVSGQFITEGQSVIDGDIYVEKSAIANISGTVNGTVYVNSTDSNVQVEDWDGSLVRARNFAAQPSSVIDTIILNCVGTGYIDGRVNTLIVDEKYNGDYGSEWNSVIQNFEYCGKSDFYNCGHIYDAKVTGGYNFSNNPGATIERVVVSDGTFNNNGRVYYAIVEKSGILHNNNTQDADYEESTIDYVVVKENAEEKIVNGELYRNLENCGNIGSLIAYGGEICTLGDVDFFYADGCKRVYIETASWLYDRGTDYQVEYFYAKDTDISFEDFSDDRTKMPKVRTARIENGSIYARDILAEELYLSGSFSGIHLERAEIYDLYIAELELTEQTHVEVPTPEEVVISDFKASSEAQDAYEMVTSEMFERLNEEEQVLLKEFVFETEELTVSGQEIEDKTFTKELEQYDVITVEFSSASAVGAVLVESPSGYEAVVMSKDDTAMESFMAPESGKYTFRVIGDDYGASLDVQVTKSASVIFDVYTQYATENPQDSEKELTSLSEFHVSVYDLTDDEEFTGFIVDGDKILFRENPKGHNFAITLSSISMPWEYEPETVEVTVNEGETKVMEAIVKQYGDYYGYTADGVVPQVYFYDEIGNFVRKADGDSYGNFWAGRLPSGNYTAILLRDDTGNYMFSRLDSFSEYGLVEKEDYLKDSFTLEAGLNICYPEIVMPEAPSVENIYFDNNLTSVNTNRQTTVAGELIQVTLNYALREEYAEKVSGLLFNFKLCENTEFIDGSVTVDGNVITGCTLEDGCLVVPADKTSGTICYQITSSNTDVTLLTTATAEFILGGKEVKQLIGMTSVYITELTASVQTVTGNGKIFVSGYTSPEETVTVLDNGTEIGELISNSSGYFSGEVKLPEDISRHKVCVARKFGTSSEIRTGEYVVSSLHSAPELLDFTMYYYVHGHSAEFHLTGEEFSTKRFIYAYWPGSVFTFELKMTESDRIDELYVVSNKGSVKKLQAFYEEERDLWVASGVFSEDENYAPADFDIEYKLKEISPEELKEADAILESSISELVDAVYEKTEVTIEEEGYDEETNTIFSSVNYKLEELDVDFNVDYSVSVKVAENTPEQLLEQGYSCVNVDGFDVFFKNVYDVDTGNIVMETAVFLTGKQVQQAAQTDDLVLFGVMSEIGDNLAIVQRLVEVKAEDLLLDWVREHVPEDKLPYRFIDYLDNRDIVHLPLKNIYELLETAQKICYETEELKDKITGKDANEARDKYNQKLDEIENMLDGMLQAQMDGTAKECGMISLAPYYENLQACRDSVNNLANSRWSFEWTKKICTLAAEIAVTQYELLKKAGEFIGDCALALGVDAFVETYLTPGNEYDDSELFQAITSAMGKAQETMEFLDKFKIDKLCEQAIDNMAGDTLEYWDNSNSAQIIQLDNMVKQLNNGFETKLSANNQGNGTGNSDAINTGAGIDIPTYKDGGGNGCFPTNNPDDNTIPGGGGDVEWDPSGYVYEGVPSNRVAGVTATTYYRGKDGNAVLWNAEEYGQINPQVTNSKGCYGWFVPEGEWKVVYEKDGYAIAETEWLPVPPPQTEVNVGIVCKEAPELKNVVLSPSHALVTFNKYVTVESVTEQVLLVNGFSGKIEAVNAEGGADGTLLASKFRIVFEGQATVGADYTVAVKNGIIGYNGLVVPATELTATCAMQPESISVELPDYILLGAENTIKITVAAEGGFEAMTLDCVFDEKFIEVIRVGKVSSDGTAELVVKGKKAGVSLLRLTIAGSDVVLEQDIVTADARDVGLMNYVEREKNQEAAATLFAETAETSSILRFGLSVVVMLLVAVFSVILLKKREKTA